MSENLELVLGKAGEPHIDGDDLGTMVACILGSGAYVFKNFSGSTPTGVMKDANHFTVPSMNMSINGRYSRQKAAEDITVTSGMSGRKRNDIVAYHYARDANQVETAEWVVVAGSPSTSNPADPAMPNAGRILDYASEAYVPMWRIPLDGITPGTPVPLFSVLGSLKDAWDSLSQTGPTTLLDGGPGGDKKITGMRWGRLIQLNINIGSKITASWGVETLTTLPAGWRPANDTPVASAGRDGKNQMRFVIYKNGKVNYENQGGSQNNMGAGVSCTYIAA